VEQHTGVGVLDKSLAVLAEVAEEPASLAELSERSGLPRATAHRLASALVAHRMLTLAGGRYHLGPRLGELASRTGPDPLAASAAPVLRRLQRDTGESAQLYRRRGEVRVCVAAADAPRGLRDTVPVGAALSMSAGSAAQVLLAWEDPEAERDLLARAAFGPRVLAAVRRRGWAASVAEREAGVASVSSPVRNAAGGVVAALSVSGPIERLGRSPGTRFSAAVTAAAERLSIG
jgi:DNA-binding IclR family transcriptional regulator